MSEAENRILILEQSIRKTANSQHTIDKPEQLIALVGLALCEMATQLMRMSDIVQDDSTKLAKKR